MMTRIHDETALWTRAQQGDGRAFAALFDAHRDRLFRHCLRLVPSAHDAEEVVAAAFLELWRKRAGVPVVDGSVLPWLIATTTNVARNTHRGVRRYRAVIDRMPRSADLLDPAETVAEQSERERVRAAIRRLNPSDAALIALTALEGYSPGDAARALGISDAAVRTRLHRARKRLRDELTEPLSEQQPTSRGDHE